MKQYRKGLSTMNEKTTSIIKIGLTVISIGVTLAANFIAGKELDQKVADKVAEALKSNE